MKARALILAGALACGSVAWAQDTTAVDEAEATPRAGETEQEARDRSTLTRLIEDNLSGAGRQVEVFGFKGALSSEARFDRMTIADEDGIWLTLTDGVLDWNRSALLRGAIDVQALTVASIDLPRLPAAGDSAPSTTATQFSLPELPVSVSIDELRVDSVTLGAAVMGEAAEISVEGQAQLAGGEGSATLAVNRIDGPRGEFTLSGGYSNATDILSVDLSLDEGEDGIFVNIVDLPGHPAVAFTAKGEAPLSDFNADIALSTDGQERLGGQVSLAAIEADPAELPPVDEAATDPQAADAAPTPPPPARRFTANISGDISPLFEQDYSRFFGDDLLFQVDGTRQPSGALSLDRLVLRAEAISLLGQLDLAADGLPSAFSLTAEMGNKDGSQVLLPLSGPKAYVTNATIMANYAAEKGEEWTADAALVGFEREDIAVATAILRGTGTIGRRLEGESGTLLNAVNGDLTFDLLGFAHADPALQQAAGTDLNGALSAAWQQGDPVEISALSLQTGDLELTAKGTLDGLDSGYEVDGSANLRAADLARFALIAGQPDLRGAVDLALTGKGAPLGGAFDLTLSGTGRDLGIGIDQIDGLIAGAADIKLDARRDTVGTTLREFTLSTPALDSAITGRIDAQTATLDLNIGLDNLARVLPDAQGPARAIGTLRTEADGRYFIDLDATAPGDAALALDATVTETTNAAGDDDFAIAGDATLKAASLAPYAGVSGQSGLRGAVDLTLTGKGMAMAQTFDVQLAGNGTNLAVGIDTLDDLILGRATFALDAARDDQGALLIRDASLDTPALRADVSGTMGQTGAMLELDAALDDLGRVAEGINGRATATGTAQLTETGRWRLALDATGPGGTDARVTGDVIPSETGSTTFDLTAAGAAPLGLANGFISGASVQGLAQFNLALRGPAALQSLSGRASVNGARVALPDLEIALTGLNADVQLANSRAQVEANMKVSSGGRIKVSGPLGLSPQSTSDMRIDLQNVVVVDPELYRTSASGRLRVTGPITAGGGRISGTVDMGSTEIKVPSSSFGGGGAIPDGITHIGDGAETRATRRRAGLINDGASSSGGGGGGGSAGIALDILVRATNQVFVRGRGLDAELGGEIRLSGTTSNVIPIGQFNLVRGRLDLLGKRLELAEGSLVLRGSAVPNIRLLATTEAEDATVQILVQGPADDIEVSFASSPELPEDEVLARLLFGRPLTEITPFQAAQMALAVATLAGKGGEGIVGKIRGEFGLDDLDITTNEDGDAALKLGKYINDNIYTDVTVDATGKSEITLNLDLSDKLSAKGSVASDGETGVGLFFETDF